MELTLQERILNHIFYLELFARVGISLFYGLSVFGFACVLHTQERHSRFSNILKQASQGFFLLGAICILIYGILEYILPINSVTSEVYTFFCFLFSVGVLFFNSKRKEFPAISFVIGSFIFLFMTLVCFLEPKVFIHQEKIFWFINFHIILSVLGETIYLISFCASILFLLNHNKLKKKIISLNSLQTSLSTLEKVVVQTSFCGLGLLTLALISGIILVFVNKDASQISLLKILWATFIWAWYAMTLYGRIFWGWKGRKGALLVILGSSVLMVGSLAILWHYL